MLGFRIAYKRPEQHFVYLERPKGAQIMLYERSGNWETAPIDPPYGRGVMFQVYVENIEPVLTALAGAAWPLHAGRRVVWRGVGDH